MWLIFCITSGKSEGFTDASHISWDCFSETSPDKIFPRELNEAKSYEFMTLRKSSMTVQKYGLNFIQLSRYARHIVGDSRAEMNKFLYGVSNFVKTEYMNAMLLENMNIFRLMTNA